MANPDRNNTGHRGFATMDGEKQKAIAAKGGRAAHQKGTAHEFSSKEAAEAGRRAHASGNAHEFDSEQARAAGRKGGQAGRGSGSKGATRAYGGGPATRPGRSPKP
jgi:general stress protein YciG